MMYNLLEDLSSITGMSWDRFSRVPAATANTPVLK